MWVDSGLSHHNKPGSYGGGTTFIALFLFINVIHLIFTPSTICFTVWSLKVFLAGIDEGFSYDLGL